MANNPTDMKEDEEFDEEPTDELTKLLVDNNLYALYGPLNRNGIDLSMLQHDLKNETEMNKLMAQLGFDEDISNAMKFRKMMRIISEQATQTNATHSIYAEEEEKHLKQEIKELQTRHHRLQRAKELKELESAAIDDRLEIILIGDEFVGKTNLITRYERNEFLENSKSSIGVAPVVCKEKLSDDTVVEMKVYDTAGQERYVSMATGYYKRADAVLVCFDGSNGESLSHCDIWRGRIEEHAKDGVFVVLVACKSDILDSQYVSRAKGILEKAEWKKYNAVYVECSAKTGENVRNVFLTAAEEIHRRRKAQGGHARRTQSEDLEERSQKKGCCDNCVVM